VLERLTGFNPYFSLSLLLSLICQSDSDSATMRASSLLFYLLYVIELQTQLPCERVLSSSISYISVRFRLNYQASEFSLLLSLICQSDSDSTTMQASFLFFYLLYIIEIQTQPPCERVFSSSISYMSLSIRLASNAFVSCVLCVCFCVLCVVYCVVQLKPLIPHRCDRPLCRFRCFGLFAVYC
jgi:hypothetical protein